MKRHPGKNATCIHALVCHDPLIYIYLVLICTAYNASKFIGFAQPVKYTYGRSIYIYKLKNNKKPASDIHNSNRVR